MLKSRTVNNQFKWIQVQEPSRDDYEELSKKYEIRSDILYYAFDIHERPRLELDEDSDYRLFIFDVPIESRFRGGVCVEPVGFLISDQHLFTFTRDKTSYVLDTIQTVLDNPRTGQPHAILDLILDSLYQLSLKYFDYINRSNRERTDIQQHFIHRADRRLITALLAIQTQMVYYVTGLNSNSEMLATVNRKLRKEITEHQADRLEDISIETNQSLSMAQVASSVTREVADAYSNVLDSDLNKTMKILTIFSIILTIPNLVFAFYGENVKLPFSDSPIGWQLTLIFSVILIAIVWYIYLRHWS